MAEKWQPSLGAWPENGGVRFRVWAPEVEQVGLDLQGQPTVTLDKQPDGTHTGFVERLKPGALYRYRLDNNNSFPDPASRFQPEGVHGYSEVIDSGFGWGPHPRPMLDEWDDDLRPELSLDGLIVYELHVGTFTPEGTYMAAVNQLPKLVELGVTAIELMPLADFPGQRNWGYDGVGLFAPARCYGRPEELRYLVRSAHRLGLGVILDVVYNHLGPDGNYLSQFSKQYFSETHQTGWGAGLNFNGPGGDQVEKFFIENALYWANEFHFDGFRLDATHAILDSRESPFLKNLTAALHDASGRRYLVIAEDERNESKIIRPVDQGGLGLDGVWADDFHHQVRRAIAGDHEGYFADYTGSATDLAKTIEQGWFYTGQRSEVKGEDRGTKTDGVDRQRFVVCIQNHDQVGNRAFGERLHHQVRPSAYRAASMLLLLAPQTPLLFMGQEWACSTPFSFFTDHNEELGKLVTEGRRKEFRLFSAFNDPAARERIPDPQAESTFRRSILEWAEADREPHASCRRLYQKLIALRKSDPAFAPGSRCEVTPIEPGGLLIKRTAPEGDIRYLAISLKAGVSIPIPNSVVVFSTEDPDHAPFPEAPIISEAYVDFIAPAGLLLRPT